MESVTNSFTHQEQANHQGITLDASYLKMDLENSPELGSYFTPVIEAVIDSIKLGDEFNRESDGRSAILANHRLYLYAENQDKLVITGKAQLISGRVITDESIIEETASTLTRNM